MRLSNRGSSIEAADEIDRLSEGPVAWRVKDFADGWILFRNQDDAYRYAEETGSLMVQGLYVRDGRKAGGGDETMPKGHAKNQI